MLLGVIKTVEQTFEIVTEKDYDDEVKVVALELIVAQSLKL